jgi:hypothetical protein
MAVMKRCMRSCDVLVAAAAAGGKNLRAVSDVDIVRHAYIAGATAVAAGTAIAAARALQPSVEILDLTAARRQVVLLQVALFHQGLSVQFRAACSKQCRLARGHPPPPRGTPAATRGPPC